MKKFISVLFLLFVISAAVSAEELNGIFGIEFGSSPEEAITTMTEKGWQILNNKDSMISFVKDDGTYANIIVKAIFLSFYEEQLYYISVVFPPETDINTLEKTIKTITHAYKLKSIQEKNNKICYYIDNRKTIFDLGNKDTIFEYTNLASENYSYPTINLIYESLYYEEIFTDKKKQIDNITSDM